MLGEAMKLLAKTPRGLEKVAAKAIEELLPHVKAFPRPNGYLGIVIVEGAKSGDAEEVLRNVPEVEKLFEVMAECPADLKAIARAAARVAAKSLKKGETFAVRTTRRGRHGFTSIDVNVRAGAKIQEVTGNPVNLSYPDKIVWIEIIGDKALISVTLGEVERKKSYPGKPNVVDMLKKIVVAQMPYLGDLKAAYKMGVRIGRAAQTLELGALYITPTGPVDAWELARFLEGLNEGMESRLEIQRKTYARRVSKVPVYVYNIYQFVREFADENIIVTSTRGRAISERETREKIKELFKGRRVIIMIGSREGVPTGIFRYSKLVVDVIPGITLSTDLALSSCVTAIVDAAILED